MDEQEINQGAIDGGNENPQENQGEQLFKQSEIDKMIQSESDRRVAQALKSFKENDLIEEIEKAKTEAEKLATMTQEQKMKHEREQYESRLKERETVITQKELKIEAYNILNEKKLPPKLIDILDYTSAEDLTASIAKLEEVFNTSLELSINERLKGKLPQMVTANTSTAKTYAEQLAIAREKNSNIDVIRIKREAYKNGEYLT